MRRAFGTNGLSVVFLAFFGLALGGQALACWQDFNNEASAHDEASRHRWVAPGGWPSDTLAPVTAAARAAMRPRVTGAST